MNNDPVLLAARYAEGDMEPAERTAFEVRLRTDASLRGHLNNYNLVHESLRQELKKSEDSAGLSSTLKELNSEFFKEDAKVLRLLPVLKWAAGVAAALLISLFLWAPWNRDLAEKFSLHESIAAAERGNNTVNSFTLGSDAYNEKDYKKAEQYFFKSWKESPGNARTTFYYALTLDKNHKASEAVRLLKGLYQGESAFRYDAAYAVALIFLKEKNEKEAAGWLKKIPPGHGLYENAQKLLGELQ